MKICMISPENKRMPVWFPNVIFDWGTVPSNKRSRVDAGNQADLMYITSDGAMAVNGGVWTPQRLVLRFTQNAIKAVSGGGSQLSSFCHELSDLMKS